MLEARSDKPDALREYVAALLATGRLSEAKGYLPELRRRESCSDSRTDCPAWTALRILIERGEAFDLLEATFSKGGVGGLLLTRLLIDFYRSSGYPDVADYNLVERRLLLDSGNPDFDGDGIRDGYDMLPNVPEGELTEKGAAFGLVLEEVFGFESAAIVPGLHEEGDLEQVLESTLTGPRVLPSRTLFVIADPGLFRGQLIPFRAIVLTREQARQLERELGVFMPLELTDFWFSKDGRRALMQWSARWTGGTI